MLLCAAPSRHAPSNSRDQLHPNSMKTARSRALPTLFTLAALAASPLFASNTTTTAPAAEPTPPATAAYTNQPAPVYVERNYDYYPSSSNGFYNSGFSSHNYSANYIVPPLATF